MSSKLDQSLDDIAGARRASARRNTRRGGKTAAPAGGVTKNTATRASKAPAKAAAPAPVQQTRGESKIIVSNLPDDVNEQQIKLQPTLGIWFLLIQLGTLQFRSSTFHYVDIGKQASNPELIGASTTGMNSDLNLALGFTNLHCLLIGARMILIWAGEYFGTAVGAVKKVLLNYNRNGRSTGVANIIFAKPGSAAEAAKTYNGVKVDGKPMKIEVIVGAQAVAAPPAPKGLGERISKPKEAAKPKPAQAAKPATANGAASTSTRGKGGRRGRGGRQGRPKTKTAEELDADMADYFEPGTGAAADAAAAAPTNGAAPAAAAPANEAVMEDEIM